MDTTPLEFSENGEFLIQSSHDGVIKVWESATNTLKSEYKPSSHLSATCSCLSWSQTLKTSFMAVSPSASGSKKKKLSSQVPQDQSSQQVAEVIKDLNLVAIGTVSGSILLYSVAKGDLHSQLGNGHSDRVNGIVWYPETNSLYSCSNDSHIIEWEITSSKLKVKWKASKGVIQSLCKCSSQYLLAAGRSITLWNLQNKHCVRQFTGHYTEVFKMLHVPNSNDSMENSYFLSAAVHDRIVNAWHIDTKSKQNKAVATFTMPDEPVDMHITQSTTKTKPLVLVVVTKCGKALIYEHKLNGHIKKPLNPLVTIQINSEAHNSRVPRPIQILTAYICDEDSHQLLLVHGSELKPNFEKVSYSKSQAEMCLIREDKTAVKVKKDQNVSKVRTPEISKDMTLLVPGQMAPAPPTQDSQQPSKRKRKASIGDMPIEERLNAVSLDQPKSGNAQPKADTLVTLLVQGLQSQDGKILNQVLQKSEHKLLMNTVRKLPVQMVIPLVQEITKRMHGHAQMGVSQVAWIQTLLAVHSSYLMTFPEIIDQFSMLYQIMDSRVTMLGKLCKLKGKLDIMLSQISAQTQGEDPGANQQPLLQFEEDSSDEDDLEELAIGPGVSDSEDNWEDFSDDESDMDTQDDVNGKG